MSSGILISKRKVEPLVAECLAFFTPSSPDDFIHCLHEKILRKKIRFPVLEHVAVLLHQSLPSKSLIPVLDDIVALHEIGSYTLAGKILQEVWRERPALAFQKAEEYILQGNEWYVCDIVGERVFGNALLMDAATTLPLLRKHAQHPNPWMGRVVGVAGHYAIKKGLSSGWVEDMFTLLLSQAGSTRFHIRKGIGWAAKTTAKFHPQLVKNREAEWQDEKKVRPWFRTKIKMGLGRAEYASRKEGKKHSK